MFIYHLSGWSQRFVGAAILAAASHAVVEARIKISRTPP